MKKLRYLKKGFSLMEIAIIVVLIGVLLIAASSIIQGRSSDIEVSRTENRLKQLKDIIVGSTKYTGFLPADDFSEKKINPPSLGSIGDYTRLFSNLSLMVDGYGNPFKYVNANSTNFLFKLYGADITARDDFVLCKEHGTNTDIYFNSPLTPNVNDVAFFLFSYGKNGKKEIQIDRYTYNVSGEGTNITIPISDPDFDDQFIYMTLDQLKGEVQCPITNTGRGKAEILTKVLAMKPEGSGQKDTQPRNSSAPIITHNIMYTNTFRAQWCVEVADELVDQDNAIKQIEAFRLNGKDKYIGLTETVPIRAKGDCESGFSSFTPTQNDSASLQIVLNSDATKLKPGLYRYFVHLLAQNDAGVFERDKQIIKVNVPNP